MIRWDDLVRTDPCWVARMIDRGSLDAVELSNVLIALGQAEPALAYLYLLRGMQHEEPIVREGALLGLTEASPRTDQLRDAVADLALNDPSSGVRLTAEEATRVITSPLTLLQRLQNWCLRVYLVGLFG